MIENSKFTKADSITPDNSPGENQDKHDVFLLLSVLLTLLAYLPLMNNQFVDWDDTNYILYNPHIRHLNSFSIQWFFTNFYGGYWIPLTWLSFSLDFWVGHLEPWIYHLDNLILHLLNTAVVFSLSFKFLALAQKRLGRDIKKSLAAFGTALLFGLHPLHVESVAWVAERKDLLCGFFYLLSLWVYLDAGAQSKWGWRKYLVCLGFFILALLSKPMAVSLPFVFILLDYWPLGRFRGKVGRVLLEKVPFLIIAVLSSLVAWLSQTQSGASWGLNASPLFFRVTNSCHSVIFYLSKMLFPIKLTAFYPILLENTFSMEYLFSVFGVALISVICFIYRNKHPYLAVAWLYYLVTLAPVLGILQVGNQAAADRFTYLPSLGPFLLVTSALSILLWRMRLILFLLAVGWGALLGTGTFRQVSTWKDSISLWENVLRSYPKNNLIVHNNLGRAYEVAGRLKEALAKFEDANASGVPFFPSRWGKARILSKMGLWDQSIQEFKTAIAMNPQFPPLHSDLGLVYERKGFRPGALAEVGEAIRLDPHFAEAYNSLGLVYLDQGQARKASEAFRKARALDPENLSYLQNLIAALEKAGQHKEALALYRELSIHAGSFITLNF